MAECMNCKHGLVEKNEAVVEYGTGAFFLKSGGV